MVNACLCACGVAQLPFKAGTQSNTNMESGVLQAVAILVSSGCKIVTVKVTKRSTIWTLRWG